MCAWLSVVGREDLAGLELNPIDIKVAQTSVGEFSRICEESQRRADNYIAKLKETIVFLIFLFGNPR